MAFVWRTGTVDTVDSWVLSHKVALGLRVAISAVLGLGTLYFLLILNTFRRYGDVMDKTWQATVAGWRQYGLDQRSTSSTFPRDNREYSMDLPRYPSTPYQSAMYSTEIPSARASTSSRSRYSTTPSQPVTFPEEVPAPSAPWPISSMFFPPTKILDLRFQGGGGYDMPAHLEARGIKQGDWDRFINVSGHVDSPCDHN